MAQKILEIECFGGPNDGKKMPIPATAKDNDDAVISEACLLHVGPDGVPHFYILIVDDDMPVEQWRLTYAGTNAYTVAQTMRDHGAELGDRIESQAEKISELCDWFADKHKE